MKIEARGIIHDAIFPDVPSMRDGTLVASYHVATVKQAVDSTICLSRSTDGGNTWKELPFHRCARLVRQWTVDRERIDLEPRRVSLVEPYYHEPEGKPIEGFTAKDFDVFRGDSTAHKLSWRGCSDLSSLKGRRLMLRALLQRSEFYSFTT